MLHNPSTPLDTTPSPLNQQQANALFPKFGVLFCQHVPEGTVFGIDNYVWHTGPNFMGIKLIPPGIHFVYYRYACSLGLRGPDVELLYTNMTRSLAVQ